RVDEMHPVGAHAHGVQRQRQLGEGSLVHAALSLAQSSIESSSARASGRMPDTLNASGGISPARARRSIFRRVAKPRSMRWKILRRATSVAIRSVRRSIDTSTESTLGRGWKTVGGTRPTTLAVAQ